MGSEGLGNFFEWDKAWRWVGRDWIRELVLRAA